MSKISVVMTLRNRADLLKYNLESLTRQHYDLNKIEVCILDGGSSDSLMTILDRCSENFTIKYCVADRSQSYVPVVSNCPANEINLGVKYVATADYIIKTDPEIIFKDPWIIAEIVENLQRDDTKMYNARAHFTREDGWYSSYEDIMHDYEKHYLFAENSLFSRSRFYFLSGFNKARFIEMGGVEELMGLAVGWDDTLFREIWRNRFGSYEQEITGQAIHMWHGANKSRPTWEVANGRVYEHLKVNTQSNRVRLDGLGNLVNLPEPQMANPAMLSKIYTIKDGKIINTEDVNGGHSLSLDLPF